MGSAFKNLVEKSFKTEEMKKLFNKNNLKPSYKCGMNMGAIIAMNNRKILNKFRKEEENGKERRKCNNDERRRKNGDKKCSCRANKECPVNEECLRRNIVYTAKVQEINHKGKKVGRKKIYHGQTTTEWKMRYNNYMSDFRREEGRKKTELGRHIWEIKDRKNTFEI